MQKNNITKVLYLGPTGSYSNAASARFNEFCSENCEFIAVESISKIIRLLLNENKEDLAAVIPIENSIEGIVRETQDNLVSLAEIGIRITAETGYTIEHALISQGCDKSHIKRISSHPQALAQCREYIFNNWGDDIELCPTLSTSAAVKSLQNPEEAAIAGEYCAKIYDKNILETQINDEKNNTTRFIFLSKIEPEKTENSRVSITFSTENTPGALNRILSVLERYGLNMSYIDSRPSRRELGEYVFYIDFAGHTKDPQVTCALADLQPYLKQFELLSLGAVYLNG